MGLTSPVSRITQAQALDAGGNFGTSPCVTQVPQPLIEDIRFDQLDHLSTVVGNLPSVNSSYQVHGSAEFSQAAAGRCVDGRGLRK
jgi:hypothetical protein